MDAISIPPPASEPERAPSADVAADSLFRKLSWLTLFRLLTITVVLGGTAVAELRPEAMKEGPGPLYALVAVTYAASLAFALALRARWPVRGIAYAQIVLDVLLAAAVVALTGFSDSVFVFLFSIAIVNASILLFRRGALVSAALSVATYFPLVFVASPRPQPLSLFVHASAFMATAALAGYLAEQLRRTGERLAVREDDLAAITALHEAVVQSVASGIVTVDPRGRITFLNRAAEQMTGLRSSELRGERSSRWFGAFQAGSVRSETDLTNARGDVLRIGYDVFPLVGKDTRLLGSAIIFQDLTTVREMERQVERSERLADLGRLAAGLAHELRNPLASMMGSIELLRGIPGLREPDARLMEIVIREAARLEELVAAFLAFSRPAPPRRAHVEVAAIAGETLDVFAHDPAAATVRIERALTPTAAWCDSDQLRQVLWNLLANATHAVGAEGGGVVRVRCATEGDRALVAVEDDGPGIAPADLKHIFTPFFTTKERGTGLGLPTVQRIVDAHGGTVSVDSEPGRGTTFTVRLPSSPPPSAR